MSLPKHTFLLVGVVLASIVLTGIFWKSFLLTDYSLAHIERVETNEARSQGLSGRSDIPEDYGMLFIFPKEGDYGFWMKNMRVPIDIIWLSDTGTIVGIERAVSPATYPDALYPPLPVRYVLETRAGTATKRGWEVGTALALPLK